MKNAAVIRVNKVLVITTLLLFLVSAASLFFMASSLPGLINRDGPGPLAGDKILALLIMLSLAGTVLCAGMLLASGISLALKKITAAKSWKWMLLDLLIAAVPLIVCGFRFTQLWNSVRGLVSILIV